VLPRLRSATFHTVSDKISPKFASGSPIHSQFIAFCFSGWLTKPELKVCIAGEEVVCVVETVRTVLTDQALELEERMDRNEYFHRRAGGACSQGSREGLGDPLRHCIATHGHHSEDGLRSLSRKAPEARRNRSTAKSRPVDIAHRSGAGYLRMSSGPRSFWIAMGKPGEDTSSTIHPPLSCL
jgi:hypothetical protein